MTIVGFGFTKIDVEKSKAIEGKYKLQNNVKINDALEMDLLVGTQKQKAIRFTFAYESVYSPDIGHIKLAGDLVFLDEPKAVKEMLKSWKDNKKLAPDITATIINTILNRSSILALMLTREVNLPPQIQLPKVQIK